MTARRSVQSVAHRLGLELSFVPLYEGAPSWIDLMQFVHELGMTPEAVEPGFVDPRTGQLLQADFLFFSGGSGATGPNVIDLRRPR